MKLTKLAAGALSLAMAVTLVPSSAFAADTTPSGSGYVLMNIPYSEFYAADVNNDVAVDAFTSATKTKTRTGTLAGGSYHADETGEAILGVTFPVKVSDLSALSSYKQVTDDDSISITTTNRGKTSTTDYNGQETLFENPTYSYYVLSETPTYYKELTVKNGKFSFGKTVGTETTLTDVTGTLSSVTDYGDFELDMGDTLTDYVTTNDKVYGVIIGTKEGDSYGMRHLENIWRVTELAWCTGFTSAVHNCPTSSEHYKKMMGETINKVTYITSKGIYSINMDVKVPEITGVTEKTETANASRSFKTTVGDSVLLKNLSGKATAISYTSSNEKIVKVGQAGAEDEGVVTILSAGSATVSVTTESTDRDGTVSQTTTDYNFNVSAKEDKTTETKPSTKPAATAKVVKGKTYKVSGNKYKALSATTVAFTTAKNKKVTKATVPATVKINGVTCKVTSIAANAFKNNKKLKSVVIGKNVTSIGAKAFSGCKNLKKITVKSTVLKKVGKKALSGINKKAVIKVPKKQKKAYKKLFKGKGQKKTVKVK